MSMEYHPYEVTAFENLVLCAQERLDDGLHEENVRLILNEGWSTGFDKIYNSPQTEQQKKLVAQLKDIIKRTIVAILPDIVPTASLHNFQTIECLAVLMYRLGEENPIGTADQLKQIILASKYEDSPDSMILGVASLQLLNILLNKPASDN